MMSEECGMGVAVSLETLKRFCVDDGTRPDLAQPWIEGDWTCATNRRLAVLVEGHVDGVLPWEQVGTPKDRPPRFMAQFIAPAVRKEKNSVGWEPESAGGNGPVIPCYVCEKECSKCGGEGGFGSGDRCPECYFGNVYPGCDQCGGTGKLATLQCGNAFLDRRWVHQLSDAFGILNFWPADKKEDPVLWRFAGGFAWVMGCRV